MIKILVSYEGYTEDHGRECLFGQVKKEQIKLKWQFKMASYRARPGPWNISYYKDFNVLENHSHRSLKEFKLNNTYCSFRGVLASLILFKYLVPSLSLFKDNIADVFIQRTEFRVFCISAQSHLKNMA